MDPGVLVRGQRGVARDRRRLRDRRDAREPDDGRHGPLVHDPVSREVVVLLVQRDDAADEPLILERATQHARAGTAQPSSVNPTVPAARSSAISVSSFPSIARVIAARKPTGTEASRSARRRRACTASARSTGGSVFGIASTAIAACGGGPRSGLEILLVLPAGTQMDVGVENAGSASSPSASIDSSPSASAFPGSATSTISPRRMTMSRAPSIPARGSRAPRPRTIRSAPAFRRQLRRKSLDALTLALLSRTARNLPRPASRASRRSAPASSS